MNFKALRGALLYVILTGICSGAARVDRPVLDIDAGDFDRRDTIASVLLPDGLLRANWIKTPDGHAVPIQIDSEGRAWFIISQLKAHEQRRYIVDTSRKPARGRSACELNFSGGSLAFSVRRRPVVQFNQDPTEFPREGIAAIYKRGSYFHPLFTPGSNIVTDDYPTNHLHHHGLWAAWTKTQFEGRSPDFWNMGDGKGTVIPMALDSTWDGPVQAGFIARTRYVDLIAKPRRIALDETLASRVYAVGGDKPAYFLLDIEQVQTAHGTSPLELLEYHYGGLGIRGPETWNARTNMVLLTSEGETDRLKAHAAKVRWLAIAGGQGRQRAGLAILCHPHSFRAPQPVRIHPQEPFFCFAPPQSGAFMITQQQPYRAAYRIVSFDGNPDAALLESLWKDYATPVSVILHRESEKPDAR